MQLVSELSFQQLDLRLAGLLEKLSQHRATRRLAITHQEIANELGTTREVVSRLLKEFELMGQISLGRGSIELLSNVA
jgi:CRP/FNR family transcriptional regulator